MDGELHGETRAQRDRRIRALWDKLDTKKKGTLDLPALKNGLIKLDHPLKDADVLIREVLTTADIDHDGQISYDEFEKFVAHTEDELWSLFSKIDRDHNGELDKDELFSAFEAAGVQVPKQRLERFFGYIDKNHDGSISFEEWRDFLLFLPHGALGMQAVLAYYQNTVRVSAEGDVNLSDHALRSFGYFIAGGISGITSRTATAPLDRLKVYLIAQTGVAQDAVQAAKHGEAVQATKHGISTLARACSELWAAGGIRSLFAGNGLNVVKVMPESAVKFGSYEASKRAVAKIEGHGDPAKINNVSQFVAGGIAGMISQAVVYPLDTLKFRMQCEVVPGGERGNALIWHTAQKMWARNGVAAFYRGLPMGLVGMFPYAAIDLGTFETLKRWTVRRKMKKEGIKNPEDAHPGNFTLALMGGFSGAIGASAVYPVNLLRTRLQSQGTASHPRTYTGIVDVTRQTVKGEGFRGLFKGLTPNLLKVVPAVSITYVVYENCKTALNLH